MQKAPQQVQPIEFREALFWDTDPKWLDINKHAVYIIERIMDFGRDSEVKWMWETYPKQLIRRISATSRVLRPQSRNIWQILTKNYS